jgi:hypothetical protein
MYHYRHYIISMLFVGGMIFFSIRSRQTQSISALEEVNEPTPVPSVSPTYNQQNLASSTSAGVERGNPHDAIPGGEAGKPPSLGDLAANLGLKIYLPIVVSTNETPLPSLSIDNVSVTEGDSGMVNASFTVSLSSVSGKTIRVHWATSNGTATAGSDYNAGSGDLIFSPGQINKPVTVVVNGDMLDENNETFNVTLSNPSNATLGNGSGLGTINDDDITIEAFYVAENGDDKTGDGTEAKPWGTINYALSKVPDGGLVLVKPGTYVGTVSFNRLADKGITLRSQVPYKARLRNNGQVVQVFYGRGLTIEGFDIAHIGPGADRYVIQIQDPDGTHERGTQIVLRDNVIHDSYNNDLVKVNNNASHITIEGNVFYNMGGPETDSHLDINSVDFVTIQDNIFFNDYEGSGRVNENSNGHFIVIKDSNENSDGHISSDEIVVRRNIFLNWEGKPGNSFIGLGDSTNVSYYQAQKILIENNLMLGNSTNRIHAVLKTVSAQDVIFRNNTIVGDLPANAFFMRAEVANPSYTNRSFEIYNNIWSDPTGTMGAENPGDENDFSITPENSIKAFVMSNDLYWNGPNPVPNDPTDTVRFTADLKAYLEDPLLPAIPIDILLPRLDPNSGLIGGQFHTIREAFIYLVQTYGTPAPNSPVIGRADPQHAPVDDILGKLRQSFGAPDLGALEVGN